MNTSSLYIRTLSREVNLKLRRDLKELDAKVFGPSVAWGDLEFDSFVPGKFALSVVSQLNGQVIGFVVASLSDNETVHIHRIAVDPMFRNARIGGQLVDAVEERAVESGAHRVTLEFSATLKVAGFYRSLGYERGSESDVRDYLVRKGKINHEDLYLPLQAAERLVYFKSFAHHEAAHRTKTR